MAQLILRDLRALLYPPPTFSPGASLIIYNSAAFKTIDLQTALNLWTPGAYGLYRAVANLDFVAWHIDQLLCKFLLRGPDRSFVESLTLISPGTARARLPRAEAVLGLPVQVRVTILIFVRQLADLDLLQVPKTQKPGSCRAAGRRLYGQVAAETKYDGERFVHIRRAGHSGETASDIPRFRQAADSRRRRRLLATSYQNLLEERKRQHARSAPTAPVSSDRK